MSKTSISAQLLDRLRELGVALPDGARLESTRASRSARNDGAWSWRVVDGSGSPGFKIDGCGREIGSQWSMAVLMAQSELSISGPDRFGAVHIDPPPSYFRRS